MHQNIRTPRTGDGGPIIWGESCTHVHTGVCLTICVNHVGSKPIPSPSANLVGVKGASFVRSKLKLFLGSSLCVGLNVSVAFAGGLSPNSQASISSVHPTYGKVANTAKTQSTPTTSTEVRYTVVRKQASRTRQSLHRQSVKAVATQHQNIKAVRKTNEKSTVHYVVVQSGDTLWSIAGRFGVSVANLAAWNHISAGEYLHVGQKLITYGSVGASLRSTSSTHSSSASNGSSSTLSGRDDSGVGISMAGAALGLQIAQYSERFIGVPYRWGGESPSGFDCSGLVQFTFGHFGIALGRTSYDQFNQGHYVSKANLQPGDLVFFSTNGPGASHVGIYVGGGRFMNGAGSSMQVDSLYEGYWAAYYIGARRVVS